MTSDAMATCRHADAGTPGSRRILRPRHVRGPAAERGSGPGRPRAVEWSDTRLLRCAAPRSGNSSRARPHALGGWHQHGTVGRLRSGPGTGASPRPTAARRPYAAASAARAAAPRRGARHDHRVRAERVAGARRLRAWIDRRAVGISGVDQRRRGNRHHRRLRVQGGAVHCAGRDHAARPARRRVRRCRAHPRRLALAAVPARDVAVPRTRRERCGADDLCLRLFGVRDAVSARSAVSGNAAGRGPAALHERRSRRSSGGDGLRV